MSRRAGYRTRIHRFLARLHIPSFREFGVPKAEQSEGLGWFRGHRSRTERGFGVELTGIQKDYANSTAVSLKQSLSNSGRTSSVDS